MSPQHGESHTVSSISAHSYRSNNIYKMCCTLCGCSISTRNIFRTESRLTNPCRMGQWRYPVMWVREILFYGLIAYNKRDTARGAGSSCCSSNSITLTGVR